VIPDWLRNLAALSVQIAAVAAAGGLAAALLRVRRPRAMLAYWQALLWAAVLLPLLQPWRAPGGGEEVPAMTFAGPASAPATRRWPWPEAVAAGLLAGVVVRALALAGGLRRLRALRRRAVAWEAPELMAEARGLAGGDARLWLSHEVRVPATFGAGRASILLPADFPHLPREQQRHVLCHELVHVRRRDWAAAVAEEALRALLWFHPAVAWLVGRVRLAREQVVDEEVVACTRARQAYLETLLALARVSAGAAPAPLAMFLRESHLMQRVDLLLEEVAMSTRRAAVSMAAGAMLVLGVGTAAVRAFPLRQAAAVPEEGIAGGLAGGVEGGSKGERARQPERKVVSKVNPVYPPELKEQGVEGIVILEVKIEASGEVSSARPVKGHAGLAESALAAVRQWRYEPADKAATMTITINYVLNKEK
jgi:TonB family protein